MKLTYDYTEGAFENKAEGMFKNLEYKCLAEEICIWQVLNDRLTMLIMDVNFGGEKTPTQVAEIMIISNLMKRIGSQLGEETPINEIKITATGK